MPNDSSQLRSHLIACLPSLVIDSVAAESGQRVVYFAHFEDERIPPDIAAPSNDNADDIRFLHGWESWGRVALKVVAGASTEALARLQAEVAILAEVRPANFPKLLYSNLFSENPVTEERLSERLHVSVEEYVESQTVANIIGGYRNNEPAVTRLALGIANALYPLWTHQRRYVHRDIKPANILIRPTGEVVVIDLGIARETGSVGLTADGWGNAPLTLGYASPEQIANDKNSISFKTDFFSIGVLMYHLLWGSQPFVYREGMGPHDIAQATESYEPPALANVNSASYECSEFVAHAMRKMPWQRQRTPDLFIDELQKLQQLAERKS